MEPWLDAQWKNEPWYLRMPQPNIDDLIDSQDFERHGNPISSKSLFKDQRELTLLPIASKTDLFVYGCEYIIQG